MASPPVLRVVHAEGDAVARGTTIGRELGQEIDRSLASYRARCDGADLPTLLAPYRAAAERSFPAYVVMLDAVAAAAEVPADELFAVNAWEELEPLLARHDTAVGRCTTFTAAGAGATILAHSEHWYADEIALIVEQPGDGAPALVSPTIAASLPAVGMNAHGVAQGIDSLTAAGDRPGIPRVLVSRHALEAADRGDAVRRAGHRDRAGGYGHVFAVPGGDTFAVETTATRLAVLEGPVGHTNHYLDPELAEVGAETEGSRARHLRLAELLEHPPQSPEDAMAVLRDDGLAPRNAAYGNLFSMVCEVESRRMWIAPGDPREHDFEEVHLTGVV